MDGRRKGGKEGGVEGRMELGAEGGIKDARIEGRFLLRKSCNGQGMAKERSRGFGRWGGVRRGVKGSIFKERGNGNVWDT